MAPRSWPSLEFAAVISVSICPSQPAIRALTHGHGAWFDVIAEHVANIKHSNVIRIDMEFILPRRLDSTDG